MLIQIKNVGKVQEASIEIDGITVIAGENNTGKSTVGKTLFAAFNSFCNVDETLLNEREDSINRSLWELESVNNFENDFQGEASLLARDVIAHYRVSDADNEEIVASLKERILKLHNEGAYAMDIDDIDLVMSRIRNALDASKNDLLIRLLSDELRKEFAGQVNNIFSNKAASIQLRIKKAYTDLLIEDNAVASLDGMLKLNTRAVYLDDEIFSDLEFPYFFVRGNKKVRDIISALSSSRNDDQRNIIDTMMAEDKLKPILLKLDSISHGDLSMRKGTNSIGYKFPDSKEELSIQNLSSGLKIFAVLKLLLLNGKVRDKGLIILDEPEIHLHPEWQIAFAELMVMLQKAFDLHILLTTHSPYFLEAIEVYSRSHEINQRCRYYQAEKAGDLAVIHDVTENIEDIYRKLAEPFQVLENVEYGD